MSDDSGAVACAGMRMKGGDGMGTFMEERA